MHLYRLRVLLSEFPSQHRHKLLRREVLPVVLRLSKEATSQAETNISLVQFSGCVTQKRLGALRVRILFISRYQKNCSVDAEPTALAYDAKIIDERERPCHAPLISHKFVQPEHATVSVKE